MDKVFKSPQGQNVCILHNFFRVCKLHDHKAVDPVRDLARRVSTYIVCGGEASISAAYGNSTPSVNYDRSPITLRNARLCTILALLR